MKLLQLFKAFSSPGFILADEGHPRLVYYLLVEIVLPDWLARSINYPSFNRF